MTDSPMARLAVADYMVAAGRVAVSRPRRRRVPLHRGRLGGVVFKRRPSGREEISKRAEIRSKLGALALFLRGRLGEHVAVSGG